MSRAASHVPFSLLIDLSEGRLSAEQQAPLRAHVAGCARCVADLAWLDRTITAMRTDDAEDAPSHVVARAVRAFRPTDSASPPDAWRRVIAALLFDSRQQPLAQGVRAGGGEAATRQLLYNAEGYDLDLRIVPAGDAWQVSGQVLGPCAGGRAALDGPAVVEATLTLLCELSLPPVPAGSYTLTVRLDGVEIVLPGLEVGA